MTKSIILFIAMMFLQTIAFCQLTDSIKPTLNNNNLFQKPVLKAKNFIIPAILISYGALAVTKGPLKELNYSTKDELKEHHPFFKSPIDNYAQYFPATTVFGLQAFGIKGRNKLKEEAAIYAMAMGINAVVVYPIKKATLQMRPDSSASNSFPSGHTATAFVAAEFLRKEYGQVSPWYGIGGYLFATGTGVFRLLNNRHWLGDIAAGAGIGIASTQLAYFIHDKIKWKNAIAYNSIIMPYYQKRSFGFVLSKHL